MSKHTLVTANAEVAVPVDVLLPPTRGSLRQQEKQRRRKARVAGDPLVVGVDLAREKQAVSFSHRGELKARKRFTCAPHQLAQSLRPLIAAVCSEVGTERVVIGMEPAGHYWQVAAESFEAAGLEYVVLHTVSVKREREATRYTPEKTDPRDADLACALVESGRFTDARLPACRERVALDLVAREYMLVRTRSAAELSRLKAFWGRVLPELEEVVAEVDGITAMAMGRALLPFSEMSELTLDDWLNRVRQHASGRIVTRIAAGVLERIRAAHASPHRRSGEGMPLRICMAAERRNALEQQKAFVAEHLLARYGAFEEAVLLDSIPGSSPLYNAITLGLVGDFRAYDSSRAVVKLAGSEVNEYGSGEWRGRSRISHRGRSLLRAAAYIQAGQLIRGCDRFRARYAALCARMTKRQARVAIGNSYLRTAHAIVVQGEPWREQTFSGAGE